MNLDPPPMLEHLLLESPWAVMGVLLIAAFVMALASRRKRSKAVALCALATLGLSAGVFVLAKAVVTDREQLIQNTHALIGATAPLDPVELDRLIDPQATVSGPDGTVWLNYDQIRPRLDRVVRRFGVQSQRIREAQGLSHDGVWGESTVIVRTQASGSGGMPVNTGWLLTWHKDQAPGTDSIGNPGGNSGGNSGGGGGWRVVDIRWLRLNGQEVIKGMMP